MGSAVERLTVGVRRVDLSLPLPTYASQGAAAFDLYSRIDLTVRPGDLALVPTNIIVRVPDGWVLLVSLRSGTPRRKRLLAPHGIGIIDRDFHGPDDEVMVQVLNFSLDPTGIERGERIAQGLFVPAALAVWQDMPGDQHGESRGGFGSTG